MPFAPVLRSEWLKIRTLRSLLGPLLALFAATTAFSAIAGVSETSDPEFDPLFMALSGVAPGQIGAISFGAGAVWWGSSAGGGPARRGPRCRGGGGGSWRRRRPSP